VRVLWISKASVTASYRKKLALLNGLGVKSAVVTGDRWAAWEFEPSEFDRDLTIYRLPQRLTGKNHFHWYRGLSTVVKQFRPDLIHIDEEHYSLVTAQATQIAASAAIPTIFQTWQNIYKRYPFPFSAIERYVFDYASAAIAGTREIQHVLSKQGFTKPIHIIPLGVDTDVFVPFKSTAFRLQWHLEGRFVVGFVGRLVPEKGVLDLLEAVLPLLKTHADWVLLIAGAGPLKSLLDTRMQDAGLGEQLRILPWLGTQEMATLMNALNVLVVPSRTTPSWKEQFGRVLIEAMAVGLPVVSYASGEIPNVLGDAGLVVSEGDIVGLRDKISTLSQNPDLQQSLRELGIQRVRQYFSQSQVAALLSAFYQEVLNP